MKCFNKSIGLLFFVFMMSCEENHKPIVIDKSWKKFQIANNWSISAPGDFIYKRLQGIDSEGGFLYSKKRKLFFEIDCGAETSINEGNCDISSQYNKAKMDIKNSRTQELYEIPVVN